MTRRETLLRFTSITGLPVMLGSCSMDAIRRAEAQMAGRLRHPGTGVQFTGLPEVVKVLILAQYPATPQQAQVAEQRARKAAVTIAERGSRRPPKKEESGKPAALAGSGTGTAADEVKTAAAVLQQQTGTTVIAVDTQSDTRLQGSRAVMLWNTQTQRFVGNNVYDISSPPAKGQVAQWGSTTARYVGSGL